MGSFSDVHYELPLSTELYFVGILNTIIGACIDVLCCRYKLGSYGRANAAEPPSLRHVVMPPGTPASHHANSILDRSPDASPASERVVSPIREPSIAPPLTTLPLTPLTLNGTSYT